jgi:hypothetical protein
MWNARTSTPLVCRQLDRLIDPLRQCPIHEGLAALFTTICGMCRCGSKTRNGHVRCCPSFKDSLNFRALRETARTLDGGPGLDARRKQPPQVLRPTELAYIAGVIDGEGTIGIYRLGSTGYYQMKVCISNCSRPLLEWVRERVGGALVRVAKATPKKREAWQLVISQYQAAPLLLECRGYLQVKRAQADLAVRYMEEYEPARGRASPTEQQVARRRWYWDETRRLNRRGPPQ